MAALPVDARNLAAKIDLGSIYLTQKMSAGERVGIEAVKTKIVEPASRLLRYHGEKLLKIPSIEQLETGRKATSSENAYFELREALGELLLSNYMGDKGPMLDALDDIGTISAILLEQ